MKIMRDDDYIITRRLIGCPSLPSAEKGLRGRRDMKVVSPKESLRMSIGTTRYR